MADFQNSLIFPIFGGFGRVFCTEQLYCCCIIVFRMLLAFLNFHPNYVFCKGYSLYMGYSLCMMADFENGLISRIFGVFSSGFFAQNNFNLLVELFCESF